MHILWIVLVGFVAATRDAIVVLFVWTGFAARRA